MAVSINCDKCGNLIEGTANKLTHPFNKKTWDLCDTCFNLFKTWIDKKPEIKTESQLPAF